MYALLKASDILSEESSRSVPRKEEFSDPTQNSGILEAQSLSADDRRRIQIETQCIRTVFAECLIRWSKSTQTLPHRTLILREHETIHNQVRKCLKASRIRTAIEPLHMIFSKSSLTQSGNGGVPTDSIL